MPRPRLPATSWEPQPRFLRVAGNDDDGQYVFYHWGASSLPSRAPYPSFWADGESSTNVTFHQAGTYTLEVNVGDGAGWYEVYASSSVVVTVGQTLTSISVTPSITALGSGQSEALKATGLDQFGQRRCSISRLSRGRLEGTITPAGLYTSNGMIDTVTAGAGSMSDESVVYEAAMVPTVASPAAADPARAMGTSTVLSVLGADASDSSGEACLSYTWSVTALPAGAAAPRYSRSTAPMRPRRRRPRLHVPGSTASW